MKTKNIPLLILSFLVYNTVIAQPQIELQPYHSGFEQPLAITHGGDDRLFIVEQSGLIKIIDGDDTVLDTPFLDLSDVVSQSGFERGLLGLAFHPEYKQNGYFFINYTRQSDGNTVVARFKADDNNPNLANRDSEKQLLSVEQPYPNHNGGQLLFGPDGYLYIALGDGGDGGDPQDNAQNLNTFLGKILRIDVETDEDAGYAIPEDNPFVNDENALDEIWAWGLRNPWRNSFDRITGDFWIGDVGQNSREEINFQDAASSGGINYGWRCYEGNIPYNTEDCPGEENFVFPVFDYPHAQSGCTGSVTGGYVYRGAIYNEIFGDYIFADYCTGNFYQISRTTDGFEGILIGNYDATEFTSFGEDQYGELYVAMSSSGEIRKVVETGDCQPVAKIKNDDTPKELANGDTLVIEAIHHPTLQYQWNKNGESLNGETGYLLHVTEEGTYSVNVTNSENNCTNTSAAIDVVSSSTSVSVTEKNEIRVFPNPAKHQLNIEKLPFNEKVNIRLINEAGTVVYDRMNYNAEKSSIPTTNFSPGVYILQIKYNSSVFQKKVVLQ